MIINNSAGSFTVPIVFRPVLIRSPRFFFVGCLLLCLGGCAIGDPGISPPKDGFYFPTGLALDPTRPFLYLSNSNADLRYNGGTIMALDLRKLPEDLTRVGELVREGSLSCSPGRMDRTSWECSSAQFIHPGTVLRMGDYPGEIRVSRDGKRLFVPERGQGRLLWADIADRGEGELDLRCNSRLDSGCGSVGDKDCALWDCDSEHRVSYSEDTRKPLPTEPFGLHLNELAAVYVDSYGTHRTCRDGVSTVSCDCGTAPRCAAEESVDCCKDPPGFDHLYVAHLSGGEVSFFISDPTRVRLRDIRGNFFNASGDIRGGFSLATKTPGDAESMVYVSSRVDNLLASFVIRDNQRILDATRAAVGAIVPGNDVRGIAFGPGGERLFLIDRLPAALVAMDMTPRENGFPKQEPIWAVDVCSEPNILQLGPDPSQAHSSSDRLAYVVCFRDSQIFVVDTLLARVVGQILTGRGPNALALDTARRRAYVANFLDNTVGVIDLDPSHAEYQRMVLQIGLVTNLVTR
jgi:hypothetical protein